MVSTAAEGLPAAAGFGVTVLPACMSQAAPASRIVAIPGVATGMQILSGISSTATSIRR